MENHLGNYELGDDDAVLSEPRVGNSGAFGDPVLSEHRVGNSGAYGAFENDGDLKHPALPPFSPGLAGARGGLPPFSPGPGHGLNNYGDESALSAMGMGSQMPGFGLSSNFLRGQNDKVSLMCMAVGCEKLAEAKTNFNSAGGFCRAHFNSWLIGTGQIEYWDCECGNKMSMESERCEICYRPNNKMPSLYNTSALSGVNLLSAVSASRNDNGLMGMPARNDNGLMSMPTRNDYGIMGMGMPTRNDNGFMNMPSRNDNALMEMLAANRNENDFMNMPANPGVQISTIRETNEYGKTLCRVIGCREMDHSMTDGFCLNHFALFSTSIGNDNEGNSNDVNPESFTSKSFTSNDGNSEFVTSNDGNSESFTKKQGKTDSFTISNGNGNGNADTSNYCSSASWTCVCGQLMSGKKKRCGKCHKWRGGKRAPYTASSATKKPKAAKSKSNSKSSIKSSSNSDDLDSGGNWTCDCGNRVAASKSRCGSCHHWRGGKRKGGWKIKASTQNGDDSGIEWSLDWSCCDVVISSKKKRCGKCHKWRGGKRFSAASKTPSSTKDKDKSKTKYAITEFI